jgi:hypothetical protein
MEEQISPSPSVDESERKFWLEYLARLNDRRVRAGGISGATSWALLGVLVAILYKAIPQLPAFLVDRSNFNNCLVLFVLEVDVVLHLIFSYFFLLGFYSGGVAAASLPERSRRLRWIVVPAVLVLQFVLTIGHLTAAWLCATGSRFVFWLLIGMAIFWAANLWSLAKKETTRFRHARRYKIPVPLFAGSTVNPGLGMVLSCLMVLVICVVCSVGFFWYWSYLEGRGANWLSPLAASSYAITFIGVLAGLVSEGFQLVTVGSYEALERAIMLGSLPSSEIRATFVRQLVGSNAAEWLNEQTDILRAANEAMQEVNVSISKSLGDFNRSRDKNLADIRRKDAAELLKKLEKALQNHIETMGRHGFLVKEFAQVLHGEAMSPLLTDAMTQWKAQLEQMAATAKVTHELRVKLVEFSQSID